jgi:hypothetical protein
MTNTGKELERRVADAYRQMGARRAMKDRARLRPSVSCTQ